MSHSSLLMSGANYHSENLRQTLDKRYKQKMRLRTSQNRATYACMNASITLTSIDTVQPPQWHALAAYAHAHVDRDRLCTCAVI